MENPDVKEKTPRQKAGKKEDETRYLVETKGYKETFDTPEKAKVQFDILKKRAIKNREKITIKIFKKVGEHKSLMDELEITNRFFGED